MSLNLCTLPQEQQEQVEVEKAAAYAVWKERNGHLANAESEASQHKGELGSYFLEQVSRYKRG
jgi:DNA polymerase-3 subunit theta